MADKILKVAHLQLLPLLSGVQRVTLDELERLDSEYFIPYIICKEPGPMTEEAVSKGINCLYNKHLTRAISPKSDMLAFWSLYKLFRKHRFDIVHSHSSKTGVLGRVAAKLAGVPMIVHTVHGYAFPSAKNKFEKLLFFVMEWLGSICSDKIICLHQADEEITKNKLGVSTKKIEILANGVDIVKYSPATEMDKKLIKQQLGIKADGVVVGMVGRLWKQKNPNAFIDAAIELLNTNVNVDFIIIGDGELKFKLMEKVKESGNVGSVHFLGWRTDTCKLLKVFDIFVLPSLWEGMPLAILEAQSTSLPCVVSNIQGNNHLVSDKLNGYLFELDTPDMLALKINKLLKDSALRRQLGIKARKQILEKYNIELRINLISDLYKKYIY